ncbi:hypothetical protein OGATHE_004352 [Ogataea polymorpha]|uniref:Uncharacterized protein n=1 Tax=Ogataea polymorpha TaxID=460523 RepID=A0A9P8T1Q3_9ASCO|nr:hypothetical protein OGATHE_004352 [Ogataea polymorpha]
MRHGLLGGEPLLVVVSDEMVDEINHSRVFTKVSVVLIDKVSPWLSRIRHENVVVVAAQFDAVPIAVFVEVVCAQHLGDFHQLVGVGVAFEKWLFFEHDGRNHGPHRPQVQRVVVLLQVDQQLRTLVVSGGDTHVEVHSPVVKLGQPPVDQFQRLGKRVNHDVLRLDVSVDDAH